MGNNIPIPGDDGLNFTVAIECVQGFINAHEARIAELRDQVHRYPDRQQVLPGITGLAQVNLGYDTSLEDVRKKVELDLDYIDERSVSKDLAIMANDDLKDAAEERAGTGSG